MLYENVQVLKIPSIPCVFSNIVLVNNLNELKEYTWSDKHALAHTSVEIVYNRPVTVLPDGTTYLEELFAVNETWSGLSKQSHCEWQ